MKKMLRVIFVLVAAAAYLHLTTASDIADCNRHASKFHTNGCSIPGDLPTPYKRLFTPACQVHDVCYRCGPEHGVDRDACDNDFRKNMKLKCHQKYNSKRSFSRRQQRDLVSESKVFEDIFDKHLPKESLAHMRSPRQLQEHIKSIKSTVLDEWISRTARHIRPRASGWGDFVDGIGNVMDKVKEGSCYLVADGYYAAVWLFGASSFNQHPELKEVCRMSFTHSCLP